VAASFLPPARGSGEFFKFPRWGPGSFAKSCDAFCELRPKPIQLATCSSVDHYSGTVPIYTFHHGQECILRV